MEKGISDNKLVEWPFVIGGNNKKSTLYIYSSHFGDQCKCLFIFNSIFSVKALYRSNDPSALNLIEYTYFTPDYGSI